jgi:aminoglycoside phosphotransferase (APT) family kinase protein
LLALCKSANIPVPTPCFLGEKEAALVLEYIEGTVDFAPRDSSSLLRQMAEQLARIHQVCTGADCDFDCDFLPRLSDSLAHSLAEPPEELDVALDEPYLRSVLCELWPWPCNRDRLLHGDYWPGNILWRDQRLAAVIDWEEATLGDPLADVAITRLDLWWAFGESAMHTFTEYYRECSSIELDWSQLAAWDLAVALRPMSNLARWATAYQKPPIARSDITYDSMRETHRRFTLQALAKLGA